MIFVLDNYDSFTFNLVHYLMELGAEVRVERNDALSASAAIASGARAFLSRPAPAPRTQAGISLDLVAPAPMPGMPLLGVCLGHQAIGQHFGGRVVRGGLMHGKTSAVTHDGSGVFAGLPSPFIATRYHSLVVEDIPETLVVNATSETPGSTAPARWVSAIATCRSTASSSIPRASPPSTATRCSPISCAFAGLHEGAGMKQLPLPEARLREAEAEKCSARSSMARSQTMKSVAS